MASTAFSVPDNRSNSYLSYKDLMAFGKEAIDSSLLRLSVYPQNRLGRSAWF